MIDHDAIEFAISTWKDQYEMLLESKKCVIDHLDQELLSIERMIESAYAYLESQK